MGKRMSLGAASKNIHFAALHQAGDAAGKPCRQQRGVDGRLRQFKHEIKIAATRSIVQPRAKHPHLGALSRHGMRKLDYPLGLMLGQAHGWAP
ncbi:MAG: hypothetical protein JM57_02005 [Comamonadaceae bacterium BICA1-1]|nr:MAG: hypothetical protein JM57_02005 [Comamonadaceae bacterium BICA1-1]